jgi:hypothetical protein
MEIAPGMWRVFFVLAASEPVEIHGSSLIVRNTPAWRKEWEWEPYDY